jgi:short-subunit dehydrogenase
MKNLVDRVAVVTDSIRAKHVDSNVHFSTVIPGGVSSNIAVNAVFRRSFDGRTREQGIERFTEIAKTTPEKAATIIVKGIRKNRVRILVGGDAVFLDKLTRLMPARYVPLIVYTINKDVE